MHGSASPPAANRGSKQDEISSYFGRKISEDTVKILVQQGMLEIWITTTVGMGNEMMLVGFLSISFRCQAPWQSLLLPASVTRPAAGVRLAGLATWKSRKSGGKRLGSADLMLLAAEPANCIPWVILGPFPSDPGDIGQDAREILRPPPLPELPEELAPLLLDLHDG